MVEFRRFGPRRSNSTQHELNSGQFGRFWGIWAPDLFELGPKLARPEPTLIKIGRSRPQIGQFCPGPNWPTLTASASNLGTFRADSIEFDGWRPHVGQIQRGVISTGVGPIWAKTRPAFREFAPSSRIRHSSVACGPFSTGWSISERSGCQGSPRIGGSMSGFRPVVRLKYKHRHFLRLRETPGLA